MSARWLVSAVFLVAGCGGGGVKPTGDLGATAPPCNDPVACACSPGVDSPPYEGATHVPEPTMVTYQANPPASGNHWPMWQEPWGFYPNELPRERWVHNLEHGGVVLLYNCPSGDVDAGGSSCENDVQTLEAIRNGRPPDQYNVVRILITPDTVMPHRFAAVAWNYRWQGDSVDVGAINCFIAARYDKAPESIP